MKTMSFSTSALENLKISSRLPTRPTNPPSSWFWTLEHAGNMLENYGRSQFFDDLWIYLVFDNKYVYVYNCI
jgi:hypothetical protein